MRRERNNIITIWQNNGAWSVRLRLVVMVAFGLFFFSASLLIFARGLSGLVTTETLNIGSAILLIGLGVPPLIACYGFWYFRRWLIFVLLAHILLAVCMVAPLLFFDLQRLVVSTLLNNLVVLVALLVTVSLTPKLYEKRFGILIVLFYTTLLLGTSSYQIYYRVTNIL